MKIVHRMHKIVDEQLIEKAYTDSGYQKNWYQSNREKVLFM